MRILVSYDGGISPVCALYFCSFWRGICCKLSPPHIYRACLVHYYELLGRANLGSSSIAGALYLWVASNSELAYRDKAPNSFFFFFIHILKQPRVSRLIVNKQERSQTCPGMQKSTRWAITTIIQIHKQCKIYIHYTINYSTLGIYHVYRANLNSVATTSSPPTFSSASYTFQIPKVVCMSSLQK